MAIWELMLPRRRQPAHRGSRWTAHAGLVLLGSLASRLISPAGALGFAWFAERQQWGLLNIFHIPSWAGIPATILLLDLGIYFQHRWMHSMPGLWRFHRMHHSDTHLDVTSGVRFHPVEMAVSMGLKGVMILVLGASATGVFLFEILLNATSLFNHSNARLPGGIDRILRWIIVTPDFHRVHHSANPKETDSNFGFNLAIWDRIFGTYCAQPALGHDELQVGLEEFRKPEDQRLSSLLLQPWKSEPSGSLDRK
ncbi:MAG: sterol desaturase family protein [Verrucomicrobia bacterium]|nr:sterol desaturase family protein [Verrucomicrobiota bacterium]